FSGSGVAPRRVACRPEVQDRSAQEGPGVQDQRRPASRSRRRGSGAGLLLVLAGLASSACESTTVSVVELSDIELSPSALTLLEGDRQQLAVSLTDVDGQSLQDAVVVWAVEDPDVAGVTSDGVVEALSP